MQWWLGFIPLLAGLAAAPLVVVLAGAAERGSGPGVAAAKEPIPPASEPEPFERIGIILVHGIGEQRRFQHLDGQMRDLLRALRGMRHGAPFGTVWQVSVDIAPSGGAAFAADQDSWNSGPEPTITVTVDHDLNGTYQRTQLLVHEVWWADVNEPYSIAKQVRFWLWGLAMWAVPERPQAARLGSTDRVAPPVIAHQPWLWDRLRLWMVGVFFVLLGYSIGTITFLATRLFNLQAPNILKTITNFISGVKLYNQQHRYGAGFISKHEEFLDSIDEPPRVSIRRRMIRAIADAATNHYHRWYVLAHSQGTIVAFNGLMETAYAWPGYLNEERWQTLTARGMAGPAAQGAALPGPPNMPRRPGWARANEIAYRSRIFARCRGFLTYGSPLQKFAGLWPALVPISRENAGLQRIDWINVYDPIDPVSGILSAFDSQPASCCPRVRNYGYAAYWVLLLAHLNYLTRRAKPPAPADDLATRTIRWMITDTPASFTSPAGGSALGSWYGDDSRQRLVRSAIAWVTWLAAATILIAVAAILLPIVKTAMVAAAGAIWTAAEKASLWGPRP